MTDGDATRIAAATADDIDPVTDLWVALAEGQRRHGSTLLAAENRAAVRDWVARAIVTGELLVARSRDGLDDGEDEIEAPDETDGPIADVADPIGFVAFALEHGGYDRDRTRGAVSNLFVVPEHRGEGVGSALLVGAERALREAGAEVVALEALANNDRAREFYAAHGYDRHRVELTKPLSSAESEGSASDDGESID